MSEPDETYDLRDMFDIEAMARINAELDDPIRVMRRANAELADDDRRKITRARVKAMESMLQDAAVMHEDRCGQKDYAGAKAELRLARELLDAIAAILPPE